LRQGELPATRVTYEGIPDLETAVLGRLPIVAAAMAVVLGGLGHAQAETSVGAMQSVRQTVYGTPPNSQPLAKHQGDGVVFREIIETWDNSGALLNFIDGSHLTLGAKSKVLIDEFVFDPTKVTGNAVIEISAGTLRWVTGSMPKGRTVIKTPTATLTLRGTDVAVHVHPNGTTDTTVYDGIVYNHNDATDTNSVMGPGDQQVSDLNGNHIDTSDPTDPGDFTGDPRGSNDSTSGDPSARLSEHPDKPAATRAQTAD
jgi:hypothetical protein